MKTVAGIFNSRAEAERAIQNFHALGIPDERISLLAPGTTEAQLDAGVPTTDTEQPGMGKALGGAVGGAVGAAGGLSLGTAAASLLIPGVGPVLAAGIIGAALFGVGGAAAGAAAGGALEENIATGLPHDELYVYEDALRHGRAVVIAVADGDDLAESAQKALAEAGAESVDAAREQWWVGLRDAEAEEYAGQGSDFKRDEPLYRRGFEAAQHPKRRDSSYETASERLREEFGDECESDPFRCGYERGLAYQERLREKSKS